MRWRAISSAVMSALVAACALVGGIDGDYVERTVQLCDEAMCAGVTDCKGGNCATEPCTLFNQPPGTACADGVNLEHIVCDGEGSCVECNGTEDCADGLACDQHFCVPLHCVNDERDADETDVDCGGPQCAPCQNGDNCVGPTDCISGVCTAEECVPCTASPECQSGFFCDTALGVCTLLKDNGQPCGGAIECKTGHCPIQDNVCCSAACDGPCEACEQNVTGQPNGMCAPVFAGTDPNNDCAAGPGSCSDGSCLGTAASCVALPVSNECRPSIGECDPAEFCDGTNPTCPADLLANQYDPCSTGQCNGLGECKTALGVFCVDDTDCSSNVCEDEDSVCCMTDCVSECEACDVFLSSGTCTPIPQGTDPDAECDACCDGASMCAFMGNCNDGESCDEPEDCASGVCTSSACQPF